jgi:capsular polysaccharide export protein
MIGQIAARVGAGGRVHYCHDLHLPTAISAARGIVVVNSSVGLDSIWLGRPTYATGRAFYALPGLVFRGTLDDFWRRCDEAVPDRRLVLAVRRNILTQTQMNGSFYRTALPSGGDAPGFAGLAEPDPSSAD